MSTMRHTAMFGFGFVLLLAQENFFRVTNVGVRVLQGLHVPERYAHMPGLVPALVLPLILFMGVHEYSLARGAGISFVLGYVTDLWGIAPVGLYAFTYVALFTLARVASLRLAAQTRWMQFLLTLAFTFVQSGIVLVLLALFGKDTWVPRSVFAMAVPHAIVTALTGPLVFRVAERIHGGTEAARASGTAGQSPRKLPTGTTAP